jgi:NAD(P)-dependent dehydrogenase (short-subunit alcohol dehydrogenase family)
MSRTLASKLYQGRKGLITGAASGIGKALSTHIIRNGGRVICADINRSTGEAALQTLNTGATQSPSAYFLHTDVSDWDSVNGTFQRAEELLGGPLDFVIPNAGKTSFGFPDAEGKPDVSTLQVNLIGVLYTMQAAINHYRTHATQGHIVVTASETSLHPFAGEPIYTASKHAVLGLVRATAARTEAESILINAVGPGSVTTPLMPPHLEEIFNSHGWKTPMETVIRAFDLFLNPNNRLSGQFAEAVGDSVSLYKFPTPTKDSTEQT